MGMKKTRYHKIVKIRVCGEMIQEKNPMYYNLKTLQ